MMTIYRIWIELEPVSKDRLFDEYIVFRTPVSFEEVGEFVTSRLERIADKYQPDYVPPKEEFETEEEYAKAVWDFREKCYGGWTEVPYEDFIREVEELHKENS